MKITNQQLKSILESQEPTKVQVVYNSDVKMNKNGNPFFHKEGRTFIQDSTVIRQTSGSFNFGQSYEELMRSAGVTKENEDGTTSEFTSSSLPWGEWEVPNKVIKHKDQFYLRLYRTEEKSSVTYIVDGKQATPEQLETIIQFRQASTPSSSPVQPVNLAFSKIQSITINGTTYEL